MTGTPRLLLTRDLRAFAREIEMFPDDATVWRTVPGVTNSAGNLALHVSGNLQHYVGHVLGGTAYVRNREREFSARAGSRADLVRELHAAIAAVEDALPRLDAPRLASPYPEEINGIRFRTDAFLMHLATHLAFHLGQAGYLRRALTGDNTSSGGMSLRELGEL